MFSGYIIFKKSPHAVLAASLFAVVTLFPGSVFAEKLPDQKDAKKAEAALDAELDSIENTQREELRVQPAPAAPQLRLIDISLIANFAFGGSDLPEADLANLQGHNHDPKQTGGQTTGVELSVGGAIDPFFYGEAHLLFAEGVVEMEEAFLVTQALPLGFQVEMGYFLTEFGLHNPTHQHAWLWNDAPVIATRVFGAEGMRGSGMRVANLLPLPWFSELHLGAQRASGETMHSFLKGAESGGHSHGGGEEEEMDIGGRATTDRLTSSSGELAYLARWENSFSLGDTLTTKIGFSGLTGPNSTGPEARTNIYGGDLLVKWRPVKNFRGFPYVIFQAEGMRRDYIVERQIDAGELENINLIRQGDLYDPYGDQEQFENADLEGLRATSLDTKDFGDYTDAADVLLGKKKLEDITDPVARKIAIDTLDRMVHPFETLHDWGFYAQLMVGFERGWSAGLRHDFASGAGESFMPGGDWVNDQDIYGRDRDPARDTRRRISPIIQYNPSEFSRFRLQYNREYADHLRNRRTYVTPMNNIFPGTTDLPIESEWHNRGNAAWSVWFTAEFLIGTHPAHKF